MLAVLLDCYVLVSVGQVRICASVIWSSRLCFVFVAVRLVWRLLGMKAVA